MYKILPLVAVLFAGCSNFTINATMCDEIASDPHRTLPQECKRYSEEKAQKAFDKTQKEHESQENIIKFSKDEDDKED